MKSARLGLFGILAVGALALTGCNAEHDAVAVGSTHTVLRTVTATAAAPAVRDAATQSPRHTKSATSTANRTTQSVRATASTTRPSTTSTKAVRPLAVPRSTSTKAAPTTTQPVPVRTTPPPRHTSVRPLAPPKTTSDAGACNIKGNISSEGEKIYHVPGQRFYNITKISPAKGERWFCSEQDAVAAGWRKALV